MTLTETAIENVVAKEKILELFPLLTLSQTTDFKPYQNERVCRQQF